MVRRAVALFATTLLCGCAASAPPDAFPADPFGGPAGAETLANQSFNARGGSGGVEPGEWLITFREYGRMFVHRDGRLMYEGDYTVTGRELRIENRAGSYGCPGPAATYSWALRQGQLELRRRNDPCPAIARVLQNARWQRQ